MNKNISVSILDSLDLPNFLNNLKEVNERINSIKVKEKFDIAVHFDVMDEKFVKNRGVDLKDIKLAKELGFRVDTHLMVEKPVLDRYIENAIIEGSDEITIHYEIESFEETLNYLNLRKNKLLKEKGKELVIGVAIKPKTDINELLKYKEKFSKLVIMTVEPGLGGQKYLEEVNEKIKRARVLFDKHIIQIDGGVNLDTIKEPLRNGVDSFVIGSYLVKLNKEKLFEKLLSFNITKDIENLPKDMDLEFQEKILQIVPNGYADGDKLIGVSVPNTRKLASVWYKYIDFNTLDDFMTSEYHEYRRFAIFCLSNKIQKCVKDIEENNKESINDIASINVYIEKNMKYINNWDFTDEVAPNIVYVYLKYLPKTKRKEKLNEYFLSKDIWKKRVGIVSLLRFAKVGEDGFVFSFIDKVIYEDYHLFQKASGWVLREMYKTKKDETLEYLVKKNKEKKLPSILLSYATEKMSDSEKDMIRRCSK